MRYAQQIKVKELLKAFTTNRPIAKYSGWNETLARASAINASDYGKTVNGFTIIRKTTRNGKPCIWIANHFGEIAKIDWSRPKTTKGYKIFKSCDRLQCDIWIKE